MLALDGPELLATAAEIACAVVMSPDYSEVEFLPVRPRSYDDAEIARLSHEWALAGRSLKFVGTLGLVGGVFHVQLVRPFPERVLLALAESFAAYIHALCSGARGDSTVWLEQLHALADPRA